MFNRPKKALFPQLEIQKSIRHNPINKYHSHNHNNHQNIHSNHINSLSLNLSPANRLQAIVLPSSKFNKFIKLIQEQRPNIKTLSKKVKQSNKSYQDSQQFPKINNLCVYSKKRRVKTQNMDYNQEKLSLRKQLQRNQIISDFPQLQFVNESLKIAQAYTSNKHVQMHKKYPSLKLKIKHPQVPKSIESNSFKIIKGSTKIGTKNEEISAWTMNDF